MPRKIEVRQYIVFVSFGIDRQIIDPLRRVMIVKQFNQSEWWMLPLSIALLVVIGALTLYMPRSRSRVPVYFTGHVSSGPPAVAHDEAISD